MVLFNFFKCVSKILEIFKKLYETKFCFKKRNSFTETKICFNTINRKHMLVIIFSDNS